MSWRRKYRPVDGPHRQNTCQDPCYHRNRGRRCGDPLARIYLKSTVYLETTIPSYLTARTSRDLVIAAHQELTAEWWSVHRNRFDLYISELVLDEAGSGDAEAAARRLAELQDIPLLEFTTEVTNWQVVSSETG